MVVAAAGNLEHGRLVELAGAALGSAAARFGGVGPIPPRSADPGDAGPGGPAGAALRRHRAGAPDARRPGLSRHDPRRTALTVLSTALGGGPSSRLFQQVREQRGLAYSVYSALAGYSDAGTVAVYAGCAPDRLDEVATVIRGMLDEVAAHGLTPAEVARAQGNLRGGLVLGLEDTSSRMNRLGRSEIDHGRQRTIAESLDRIAAVTERAGAGAGPRAADRTAHRRRGRAL